MSLKPYPEYKDSGVEWLGMIPETWRVVRTRDVAQLINGYPFDSSKFGPTGVPLIRIRDLNASRTENQYDGDIIPQALVTGSDVLVGMDGDFNVGRWRGTSPALLNQRVLAIRSSHPLCRWLFYALPAPLKIINDLTYATTVKHLSSQQVAQMRVGMPSSLSEQDSILSYLDRETAEIDAFIADQERLIALLAERRTATITHAVTKGLDPNAPTKESGIDWLGKIPSHWHVHNGRRYFSVRNERARSDDAQLAASQEYGVIEQQRYVELTGNRVVVVQKGFDILKHVERGDFVISMRSFQGGLEYSEVSGQISSAYVILTPSRPLVNQYFKYLFKSSGYISALRSTSNLVRDGQAMRFSNFAQVSVAVPPLTEQHEIVRHLSHELSEIEAATMDAQEAITLSKERRAALISAAVTGKIDVRGLGAAASMGEDVSVGVA